MRNPLSVLLVMAIAAPLGCVIPDIGIEVYSTQECGYQFSASTNWAWGVDGFGKTNYVVIDDEPIAKKWCLAPDEAELMQFPQSWIRQQILDDIIATCQARAIELVLGTNNCSEMASVAYSGPCPGKHEWCEEAQGDDEVGTPDLPPS